MISDGRTWAIRRREYSAAEAAPEPADVHWTAPVDQLMNSFLG